MSADSPRAKLAILDESSSLTGLGRMSLNVIESLSVSLSLLSSTLSTPSYIDLATTGHSHFGSRPLSISASSAPPTESGGKSMSTWGEMDI